MSSELRVKNPRVKSTSSMRLRRHTHQRGFRSVSIIRFVNYLFPNQNFGRAVLVDRRYALEVRLGDRVHQSLLDLGSPQEDLGLKRFLSELRFRQDNSSVSRCQGLIAGTGSMDITCGSPPAHHESALTCWRISSYNA